MSVTVFLALGSNMGDSQQELDQAIRLLQARLSRLRQAPLYRTKAVGYTDQPDFLNTAIRVETQLPPMELLQFVKATEAAVGRIVRFRWGPREIDIDIIFYGDQVLDTPALTIPHPRFAERDFVLRPIADIDPDFVDPRSGHSVQQLLADIPADQLSIVADGP